MLFLLFESGQGIPFAYELRKTLFRQQKEMPNCLLNLNKIGTMASGKILESKLGPEIIKIKKTRSLNFNIANDISTALFGQTSSSGFKVKSCVSHFNNNNMIGSHC